MEVNVLKSGSGSGNIRRVEITIGEIRYHITENNQGMLTINKPDMDQDSISIKPEYGNQISII